MSKQEYKYALGWSAAVMLATCLPYLIAWWYLPLASVFPWTMFNSDDHGVYFAWMRQAADGQLLFRNLFTIEPQRGIYLQTYFLTLGQLARLPGIDVPVAYHIGRVVFGIITLALVYRMAAFFTADVFARRCIFWTTALSAGFGWLFWFDREIQRGPIDVWQSEAVTFASLYVNGLFAVSLALMLGLIACMLQAEEKGWRWAVGAGVCGLLLGNIHSYDVIQLTAIWVAYLALRWIVSRKFPRRELGYALIAAAIAAPSVAHMAWLYLTEPIFKARADTPTLTPPIRQYLLGYGLLFPLAAVGVWRLWPRLKAEPGGDALSLRHLLPIAWAVTGMLVIYLPFAFQRKLIMGEHLALSALAGAGLAWLAQRLAGSRPRVAAVLAILVLAVMSLSNVQYMARDLRLALRENATSTGAHPAYWPEGDMQAFQWLHRHSAPDARLLTWPLNGVLAPAFSGRSVYAGHWGETPAFGEKFPETFNFYWGLGGAEGRREFLRRTGVNYVLESAFEREAIEAAAAANPGNPPRRPLAGEPFLREVFTAKDTVLYQVIDP
ncbi:MAG: hypothetical protein ACO1SX_24030 [Actinomycetota bacterium]